MDEIKVIYLCFSNEQRLYFWYGKIVQFINQLGLEKLLFKVNKGRMILFGTVEFHFVVPNERKMAGVKYNKLYENTDHYLDKYFKEYGDLDLIMTKIMKGDDL